MKVEIELDELNNLREELEHQKSQCASQVYRGNSISYIYQKMEAYRYQVGELVKELDELKRKLAVFTDGMPESFRIKSFIDLCDLMISDGHYHNEHPCVLEWLRRIAEVAK